MGSKRVKQLPCEEMIYYSYFINSTRKLTPMPLGFTAMRVSVFKYNCYDKSKQGLLLESIKNYKITSLQVSL